MYAVGRLSSYITRGVHSVSNPFHPFSGAIDIIVVEQQNGSLKSSPWYVQFGKFQGVLKSKENVVNLNVNGVDADFSMYLDNKGEAYFIRDGIGKEDSSDLILSSLRDSTDGNGCSSPRLEKTRSCNYDLGRESLVSPIEGDGNITGGAPFGLVFRSSSAVETGMFPQERSFGGDRQGSLERAEIAADLLEMRWSTNLPPSKNKKGNTQRVADLDLPDGVQNQQCYQVKNDTQDEIVCDHDKVETQFLTGLDNHIEAFTLQEAYLDVNLVSDSSKCPSQTDSSGSNPANDSEDGVSCRDKQRNSQDLCSACSTSEEVDDAAQIVGDSTEMRYRTGSKLPPRVPEHKNDRNMESTETKHTHEQLNRTDGSTGENCSLHEAPDVAASGTAVCDRITEADASDESESSREKSSLRNVSISNGHDDPAFGVGEEAKSSDLCNHTSSTMPHSAPCIADELHRDTVAKEATDIRGSVVLEEQCPVHDRIQTAESAPSLESNSSTINVQGINSFRCNCHDSNCGRISVVENEIPALEMEAEKQLESGSCSPSPLPSPSAETPLVVDDSFDTENERKHKLASASFKYTQIEKEMRKILLEPAAEISLCGHLLTEDMGYEAAAVVFDGEKLDMGKIASLGSDLIKDDRLVVRIGGLYFPWVAALDIVSKIGTDEQILSPKGMITVDQDEKGGEDPQKMSDSKKSGWTLWPFSADKSNSGHEQPSTPAEADKSSKGIADQTDTCKDEAPKKKVLKAKTPTSQQLASLNLKEGKNIVTFTYSTSMLGEQKVDARIFLWKWDARIVISDVDGTITKSDVLGQFMPLMGYDWTQTGVTHLFSAIKENGYELLFLSARAISQACITRQFLINLKQDDKYLPEGPIVISPDGLFPSLFREVIRRAPHEFKIACLEDIKALFPPETNPFYAGFGNRDTDEVSYLKVGIPQGKIFIINPKGEVAVHRRVDTKSYTTLHTLVHNIFPPPCSVPISEQEDYNTWNFWKLPPPDLRS